VSDSNDALRARLAGLSRERLIDLLIACGDDDDGVRRRILLAAAAGAPPREAVQAIKRGMAQVRRRSQSFVAYSASGDVARDLSGLREGILELAERGHAREAEELLGRLVALSEDVLRNADDSNGSIGDEGQWSVQAWGTIAARVADRDRIALARQVCAAALDNDFGVRDRIVRDFAGALGEEGLLELRRVLREQMENLPLPRKEKGELIIHGLRQETEEERVARCREYDRRSILSLLQDVADARGDVDEYIGVCTEIGHVEIQRFNIARRLLNAGRALEALRHVEAKGGDGRSTFGGDDPVMLHVDILVTLDRRDDAARRAWDAFGQTLRRDYLERVIELMPAEEIDSYRTQAVALAEQFREVHCALGFLLDQGEVARAAALIDRRVDELYGGAYTTLLPVAERLSEQYPRQAWDLYRLLLEDILKRAYSRAYGHAARYLRAMSNLAARGGFAGEQADFEKRLRAAHGRKKSFWELATGGV